MSRDRRFLLDDTNERAFDDCYRQTLDAVYAYAVTLTRSPDQARDVIHDVYAAVWTRWPPWRSSDSPRAYLFRAVRNRVLSARRHERVEQRLDIPPSLHAEIPGMGTSLPSPDSLAVQDDTRERLRAAIDNLPERQRSALLLWWDQDLSLKEIAEILEISPPAAHKLLAKAQMRVLELARVLRDR